MDFPPQSPFSLGEMDPIFSPLGPLWPDPLRLFGIASWCIMNLKSFCPKCDFPAVELNMQRKQAFLLGAFLVFGPWSLVNAQEVTKPAILLQPAANSSPAVTITTEELPQPTVLGVLVQSLFGNPEDKARKEIEKVGSHQQIKAISIKGKTNGGSLQTLTVNPEGKVLALVAMPRQSRGSAPIRSEIHVLDSDGVKIAVWDIPFHAHSLNCGPDGTVYVAGDAKLARFDSNGKLLGDVNELPHIADLLKDKKGLRDRAEKQVKSQKESFANSTKQFKDRLAKLETKKEEDRTKSEKAQVKQYKEILESFKESEKFYNSLTPESVMEDLTSRLRVINGVAISDKDVFLACGESEGYGYSIWRMDPDLKNPKRILSNIGGCCGQMDIQCCGSDILVAENTRHQFAKYDRYGKEIGRFGKNGKETDPGCFGGCCNPMNVRFTGTEVYTAESEGIIKRFTPTGEFLGMLGAVSITGGCKNVAVAANKEGSRVYFCDQPGSKVLILAPKSEKKNAN